jgi:hypothetical protein
MIFTGVTDPRIASAGINLLGPDDTGDIRIMGFKGEGRISFFNISGKFVLSVDTHSGRANIDELSQGLWLWVLYDMKHNRVSQGKIFIFI